MKFTSEVFPYKFQLKYKKIFFELSKFEYIFIKKKKILKPIFIFGSPRSGTTLINKILYDTNYYASTIQSDMPFISLPIFWSFFSKFYYLGNTNKKRFHNERLDLTKNSPESFEEFIWKIFFEDYKNSNLKPLKKDSIESDSFEKIFKIFIQKILYLRKKKNYLSKNNLNILRINYLKKIFPDAKFIFCVRNPLDVINSQTKLDGIFTKSNEFSNYLEAIGHYEFGIKKRAIQVGNYRKIENLWNNGDIFLAYLNQWINLNDYFLKNFLKNNLMRPSIFVLSYENFLKDSKIKVNLSKFLGINSENLMNCSEKIFLENYEKKNNFYKDIYLNKLNYAYKIYENIVNE